MSIEVRTAALELELREDGDGRTLVGLAMPYGVETRIAGYTEKFAFGAFADARPEETPLLAVHDHESLPIGRAIQLTEKPNGLEVELRISQTRAGDDVLELVKDRAVSGLSTGFIPLQDRWNRERTMVERIKAKLVELSIVPFPAYESARILAVRAEDAVAPRTPRLTVARYRL